MPQEGLVHNLIAIEVLALPLSMCHSMLNSEGCDKEAGCVLMQDHPDEAKKLLDTGPERSTRHIKVSTCPIVNV